MAETTQTSRESLLQEFVDWADQHITGDEKGQAQVFLDRLFRAFGQKGAQEVGGVFEDRIKLLFEDVTKTSFADYVWKPVVLFEMKKRGADLAKHRQQAFDYWTHIAPGRPKYVVLCNFDEFWVYDFNNQLYSPKDKVKIADLPSQWGPLAFLFPTQETPTFGNDREKVTREAADKLAACFKKLVARKINRDVAQRFILQSMVAMFAEDIGLLPRYLFTNLLKECKKPSDSYDLLGGLFEAMNSQEMPTGGRYKGVRYFNGGVFLKPARVELTQDELVLLRGSEGSLFGAAQSDWSQVSPEIFGVIFQDSMESEERHAYGAHYTSASDIMKIVKPTISDPWTEAISNAKSPKELNDLLNRLTTLRVLDPACGSGNFLYLAYREMKRLETRIREKLATDYPGSQPILNHVSGKQFYGMDINSFAVELAKVTLMLGRKLAIDELHIADENDLPLDNLNDNFAIGDALMTDGETEASVQTPWEKADVIIGNPPFLGAKRLKPERGTAYINKLRKLYPEVPGMADYCVYWFRRAQDHLPTMTKKDPLVGRAGLVGTQNIRNNQSRVGGLDHVVANGAIVDAVDNQPWSGDAKVHVSLVNWVKTTDAGLIPPLRRLWYEVPIEAGKKERRTKKSAPKEYQLAYRECTFINSSLSDMTTVSSARRIASNKKPQRVFQGVTPGYSGFVLSRSERSTLISSDPKSAQLIKPYMIGRELASRDGKPRRYLIDADGQDLLSLAQFKAINSHLLSNVLPKVKESLEKEKAKKSDMIDARADHLQRWWTFWARRTELRNWISDHDRIIAGSRTQRIPFIFTFISTDILPGDKLQLFAFDDDYSFGIIQSSAHCLWYSSKGARLKNEADYNYSSASVFDTFPWPQSATADQIEAVASASVEVRKQRRKALAISSDGLRTIYNTMELPGKHPLKTAHADLDSAVLGAYGFSAKKDLLAQLLELNETIVKREKKKKPVIPPGIPSAFADVKKIMSEDCIEP